jgi:hypothetical protein
MFRFRDLLFVLAVAAGTTPVLRAQAKRVDYNREIRPILSNVCYKCHGPDEKERKAGLRLDTPEGATKLLETGARALVTGNPEESELLLRVESADPNLQMPPPGSGKELTKAQKALIRRWVEEGASMQGHWAFIPPVKREAPLLADAPAEQTMIDRFIVARLRQEGLAPSPRADRVTLIRRLTLDLTGLPPTPAEVDAFVSDSSSDAYEKVVDRLLASARYGEHMARYWLDAARYGDTHGLHLDNERAMWLYRDWVISAFNQNLPFDQFTIEQLAGDLLPNASIEQQIASGFNRCNVTTSEGGSIDEEVLVRYAVDRVETTATVWMGLTLGCSVCHDHKYDPFTQREFYGLYAFFNNLADAAMDGNALGPPPVLKVPTPEQQAELARLDDALAQVRSRITEALARVEYKEPPGDAAAAAGEPRDYVWIDDELPKGAKPEGNTPWEFVGQPDHPVFSKEKSSTRAADALSQHFFTGANPALAVGEGDRLFAHVYLDPENPPKEIMLQWNDGTWEHRATWGEDLIPWGNPNSPSRHAMGPLPPAGQWVRLEVEAAKVGLNPGAQINGWAFTQHAGRVYWDRAGIVTRTPQAGATFESLQAWLAFERALSKSSLPGHLAQAARLEPDKRTEQQNGALRDYFLENVCGQTRPIFEPLKHEQAELEKRKSALAAALPMTMVSAELGQKRDAYLLVRGQYDKKADKVTAGTPAALPAFDPNLPSNRLGFARWLTSRAHPLTARVTVNRLWQQLFGTGIVKTAEDFGSQGQWPSHPELLDWLAVDFIDSGWNVKRMLKQIVMSAAYQQSSRVTPELAQRDPANELLARGARFRLDAEAIRDGALFASGLLVERLGGRSVKPYQPEGLWEAVAFVGSTTQNFKQDAGDALYRRSLYTFWKRTCPPPGMLTFDAPSRETCTVRRARTNTPLQALALLNDVQYVEAARKLAERAWREGGATDADRAALAFRLATSRRATDAELALLLAVYEAERAEFARDSEAAVKLLAVGESKRDPELNSADLAAFTLVANLILNLDETVTRE